jgi:hypothetical protein
MALFYSNYSEGKGMQGTQVFLFITQPPNGPLSPWLKILFF